MAWRNLRTKEEDDQKAPTLFKLTDNRSGRGNRVGEVGPAQSADPVPNDGGVGGGRGEGGGGGEDAGDGDEVFVAGDVTVEWLEGAGCSSRTSHFEASNGGEVFDTAVTLLFNRDFFISSKDAGIALKN